MKRFKIMAVLAVAFGGMYFFCPWFADMKPVSEDHCHCEQCSEACVHDGGDECDCHDDNCGCPNCAG